MGFNEFRTKYVKPGVSAYKAYQAYRAYQKVDDGDPSKLTPEEAKTLIDVIVSPADLFPSPYDKLLPEIAKPVKDTIDTMNCPFMGSKNPNNADLFEDLGLCEREHPDIKPAQDVKSPLAIDLDGDGIATYALKNGVFFDIDADGFAEKMAWLNGKDAFLAIDRNKNGVIDNATELFGDLTAENGFEALKALDSNGDGIIDVKLNHCLYF